VIIGILRKAFAQSQNVLQEAARPYIIYRWCYIPVEGQLA
jgi:hypothetical protein